MTRLYSQIANNPLALSAELWYNTDMKTCTTCDRVLPESAYHYNKGSGKLYTECKACRNQRARDRDAAVRRGDAQVRHRQPADRRVRLLKRVGRHMALDVSHALVRIGLAAQTMTHTLDADTLQRLYDALPKLTGLDRAWDNLEGGRGLSVCKINKMFNDDSYAHDGRPIHRIGVG